MAMVATMDRSVIMNGKGDKRRKTDEKKYRENYDKAFRNATSKREAEHFDEFMKRGIE